MSGLVAVSLLAVAFGFTLLGKKILHGFDHYRIKKGRHYSTKNRLPWWLSHFAFAPKTMRFKVYFENCAYVDNNDGDVNKLYGISYGFDNHYRSIRVGWRYNEISKKVILYSYVYMNGHREIKELCEVDPNYYYLIGIVPQPNSQAFVYVLDERRKYLGKAVVKIDHENSWFRFKQFPYFGGDLAAPNDLSIHIQDKPDV